MKERILNEIRRTANLNGGRPLGFRRFQTETGIRIHDWFGKYWKSWGDAVTEAGFAPNSLQGAIEAHDLLARYASLVRELGKIPVKGDLRLKSQRDPSFPSDRVFDRLGSKPQVIARVHAYCLKTPDWADVLEILSPAVSVSTAATPGRTERAPVARGATAGFVYLVRSGKYYKIGRTNSLGRRQYELAIQLPEKIHRVHEIATDDPEGIELYWHRRFEAKRVRGEWFKLDPVDVTAFKRRRFQ